MSSLIDQAGAGSKDTLWNQAYDKFKTDLPELARKYEALVSKEFLNGAPYMSSDRGQISRIMQISQERVEKGRLHIGSIAVHDALSKAAAIAIWAKNWIDSAVSASPEASLAWSMASMALPLLIRPAAAENDCTNGFVYVTDRMVYYSTLEDALTRLENYFGDDLIAFYRLILEYQVKTILRLFRNAFKNFGRDVIQHDNWQVTAVCNNQSQIQLAELARAADDRHSKLELLIVASKENIAVSQDIRDTLAQQTPLHEETLSVLRDISDKLTSGSAHQSKSAGVIVKMININRDEDFVKRDTLMDILHRKCSRSASTTALIGLGGTGKSQLALEYAHNMFDKGKSVFWIYAGSFARFEQGFRILARKLGFTNWDNSDINIFPLVQQWLEDEANGPWFMVIDNLDEASFLDDVPHKSDLSSQPLKSYLPVTDQGAILITTRSKQAARYLVDDGDFIIVEPMNKAEAAALFLSKAPGQKNNGDCIELMEELDFMPLAIVHAASYIARRGWNTRRYLNLFRKSDIQKSRLLSDHKNDLRRDRESRATILTTWQITFDYLNQTRPSAAYLLSIMSLFDRNSISQQIFLSESAESSEAESDITLQDNEFDAWRKSYMNDETALEDDILVLREYFLVALHADGLSLQMHRLVQLGMYTWLEKNNRLDTISRSFLRILRNKIPDAYDSDAANRWQIILPHFQSAESHAPYGKDSKQDWASVIYAAASHMVYIQGRFWEGGQLFERCVDIRLELFGRKNALTLKTQVELAQCKFASGSVGAAYLMLEEIGKLQTQVLGSIHPDTLRTMRSLGNKTLLFFEDRHGLEKAENLLLPTLERMWEILGPTHPESLATLDDIAVLRIKQRKLRDAEVILTKVVELSKDRLGGNHIYTLARQLHLLRFCREELGKPDIEGTTELVKTSLEMIGEEPMQSLSARFELAWAYQATDKLDEAIKVYHDVKSVSRRALGESSDFYCGVIRHIFKVCIDLEQPMFLEEFIPDVIQLQKLYTNSGNLLAGEMLWLRCQACYATGQWADAEQMANIILDSDSPFIHAVVKRKAEKVLVVVYWKQDKKIKASIAAERLMEKHMAKKGGTAPDTIESITTLARLNYALGNYIQADIHATTALVFGMQAKTVGTGKLPATAVLASTLYRLGKDNEARLLDQEVLSTIIKVHTARPLTTWSHILRELSRIYTDFDLNIEADEVELRLWRTWQVEFEGHGLLAVAKAEHMVQRFLNLNRPEDAKSFESKILAAGKALLSGKEAGISTIVSLTDLKQRLERLSQASTDTASLATESIASPQGSNNNDP